MTIAIDAMIYTFSWLVGLVGSLPLVGGVSLLSWLVGIALLSVIISFFAKNPKIPRFRGGGKDE